MSAGTRGVRGTVSPFGSTRCVDPGAVAPPDSPAGASSHASELVATVRRALTTTPTATLTLPARPGLMSDWPDWLPDQVRLALREQGVHAPWQHQREAADGIWAGRHTLIATGTGSGKSLAYLLPTLAAAAVAGQTALHLSPTKALAQDQLAAVNRLGLTSTTAATYDGDTPLESRAWVRRHANLVFSNPDMLHHDLLAQHHRWSHFYKRLRIVVLDEAHHYRGVFGSHVAALIRRLRRICATYGCTPTFVLSSATMAGADENAARLIGADVVTVSTDRSSRGPLEVVVVDPGAQTIDQPGAAEPPTALSETAAVLIALTRAGVRSLGFVRGRKGSEVLAGIVKDRLSGELASTVSAYRGGLLPEERRTLEARLRNGDLRTVATTNALELGVDISGLDVVVLCGWPGTRASFLQQVGRAGRAGAPGVAVLIADDNPLDRFVVNHSDRLMHDPLETTVVNVENPHILLPQLAAAIAELPQTPEGLTDWFGASAPKLTGLLQDKGWVRQRRDTLFWTASERGSSLVDLRGSGRGPVRITEAATGQILGTVDESSAPAQVHEGAVYVHLGRLFLIDGLDLDEGVAIARPASVDFLTAPSSTSSLTVLEVHDEKPLAAARLALGTVEVTSQVTGFSRKSFRGQFLGYEPLDMPVSRLRTRAVWWVIPDELRTRTTLPERHLPGGLHAAEHASIGILPGFASCDRWDVGGLSTDRHPDTGLATVFVYDGHPGGAGIADHAFLHAPRWLSATHDVIASCRCEAGCPRCVQSPKCGNGNEPLDKATAVELLRLLCHSK